MGVTRRLPLPVGVVTLLFSDIEGSTRLVRVLGDAFERVLADHNRPLREAWRRHGGVSRCAPRATRSLWPFPRRFRRCRRRSRANARCAHVWQGGG
jgi:class 3 adenylate cyclase